MDSTHGKARSKAGGLSHLEYYPLVGTQIKNLCEVDRCLAQRKAVALSLCGLFTAAGAGSSVVSKLDNRIELSASSFSALNGQFCNSPCKNAEYHCTCQYTLTTAYLHNSSVSAI